MESEYPKNFHNKFVKDKIQSVYDNYKKEHNNTSPRPTIYNDEHQLT
jgi:hypothetical protein